MSHFFHTERLQHMTLGHKKIQLFSFTMGAVILNLQPSFLKSRGFSCYFSLRFIQNYTNSLKHVSLSYYVNKNAHKACQALLKPLSPFRGQRQWLWFLFVFHRRFLPPNFASRSGFTQNCRPKNKSGTRL